MQSPYRYVHGSGQPATSCLPTGLGPWLFPLSLVSEGSKRTLHGEGMRVWRTVNVKCSVTVPQGEPAALQQLGLPPDANMLSLSQGPSGMKTFPLSRVSATSPGVLLVEFLFIFLLLLSLTDWHSPLLPFYPQGLLPGLFAPLEQLGALPIAAGIPQLS